MPTDYAKLTENLCHFYDFTGKTVLYIGAGGRQLLDPSSGSKKLLAVDQDAESLRDLRAIVAERGWQESVDIIASSFANITTRADVVYFEFCLHEMDDPSKSLAHARELVPDIVVYDHAPNSEWIYYGAEEDKVRVSSDAMERFGIRRRRAFHALQRFQNHAELAARLAGQGELAIQRAQCFAGALNIAISMEYEAYLL